MPAQSSTKLRIQFRMRIYRDGGTAVGPGKIALLEAVVRTGSITAAAQEMGMSYRRAWLLIHELNRSLRRPAVATAVGGARGGGTTVTETGHEIIRRYRSVEAAAERAAAADLAALKRMLAP
ncbi:LysR family transcriptional regulator [uncultured Pigmentiphaga sp.]|uniref:winged helix-turn-helix domain-containing protein n=1 Tax=uncultured Pigmentiphaga sp. TaxID=340361 RepID=UPI00260FBDF0|nr:LysR family transcriptional regulator [uncultured Pigmentiphaga sp.]